jgi:hypothetical protein
VNDALFEASSTDLVLVRDIDVFSMCEHHMLPFFGRVHIGYIPNGKVLGESERRRGRSTMARGERATMWSAARGGAWRPDAVSASLKAGYCQRCLSQAAGSDVWMTPLRLACLWFPSGVQ